MQNVSAGLRWLKAWYAEAHRMRALLDGSAWLMIMPAMGALFCFDPVLAKTMAQWCLPAVAIAGLAIIVSRVVFPQVHLNDLIDKVVGEQSLPAAVVIAALMLFVGVVFLAIVLWAKA